MSEERGERRRLKNVAKEDRAPAEDVVPAGRFAASALTRLNTSITRISTACAASPMSAARSCPAG